MTEDGMEWETGRERPAGGGKGAGPVVVKVGGSVLADGLSRELLASLRRLHGSGTPTVLVHGGGTHVTAVLDRMGIETHFVDGLRVTTPEVMEVVEMVLAGSVNKAVVSALQKAGIPAVGLSGKDGGLLTAVPHPDAGRLGLVGTVDASDPRLLRNLLAGGFVPVVCSVAGGPDGETFNVNADEAASGLAASVGAGRLVLLTDVPGVMVDGEVVHHLTPEQARGLLDDGSASGGMRPKLRACLQALRDGAASAHVLGEDRVESLLELVTGSVDFGTTVAPGRIPANGDRGGSPDPPFGEDPRTLDVARAQKETILGTYLPLPLAFTRGKGARIEGLDGRSYLDFIGGIAVSTLGHAHPALVRAVSEQVARYLHVSNLYLLPEQIRAAELLIEASGLDRVFFCNSGAESVEGVIKVARKWGKVTHGPETHRIVVMDGAFHGRTLGALSATSNPRYRQSFEPLVPGFDRVPFDDLDAVAEAIGAETCAVLVEPIQGEAGVIPPDDGYLQGLRELTREKGVLLALDEVQTGMGRTGSMFAYQHYGIEPDLVAVSKGLGGGVPVGAVLVREQIGAVMEPGDHATTFGGNALSSAASAAVLETLLHQGGLEHGVAMGDHLRSGLERIAHTHVGVEGVRGLGLLLALEVPGKAKDLTRRLAESGLLVNGLGNDALRFAPPILVERDEVDEALEILDRVLGSAEHGENAEDGVGEGSG